MDQEDQETDRMDFFLNAETIEEILITPNTRSEAIESLPCMRQPYPFRVSALNQSDRNLMNVHFEFYVNNNNLFTERIEIKVCPNSTSMFQVNQDSSIIYKTTKKIPDQCGDRIYIFNEDDEIIFEGSSTLVQEDESDDNSLISELTMDSTMRF